MCSRLHRHTLTHFFSCSTWCAWSCPFAHIHTDFWVQKHQIISINLRTCPCIYCVFPCRIFHCFLHIFLCIERYDIWYVQTHNLYTHISLTRSLTHRHRQAGTRDFWIAYRFYFSVECCYTDKIVGCSGYFAHVHRTCLFRAFSWARVKYTHTSLYLLI